MQAKSDLTTGETSTIPFHCHSTSIFDGKVFLPSGHFLTSRPVLLGSGSISTSPHHPSLRFAEVRKARQSRDMACLQNCLVHLVAMSNFSSFSPIDDLLVEEVKQPESGKLSAFSKCWQKVAQSRSQDLEIHIASIEARF